MALFGMKYAFMSLDDMIDEEEEYIKSLNSKKRMNEGKGDNGNKDLSEDERFKRGNAYSYAHTGDKVDIDGVKYEISTDEDGNHRIGYSDELYLKNVETGETKVFPKSEFIAKAQLLREDGDAKKYGVWQNVEASRYSGRELLGFVAKGLSREEAEAKAKELTDKYGKFGTTYEIRELHDENEQLVEEPIYDLSPVKSSQKSFYGKARVDVKPDGTKVLWSYNTPVCKIENGEATLLKRGYLGWFSSPTTLKHVRDFLAQNGFEVGSKNELNKMYKTEVYEELQTQMNEAVEVNLFDSDEAREGKEVLNKEHDEVEEKIVDVDANTVAELKDSYVGNAILQCPVCRTLIYKKPDALVKEDDVEIYNKGEACPHCGSDDGYELVGQVAEMSVEVDVDDDSTTGKEEVDEKHSEEVETENVAEVDEVEEKDEDDVELESLEFDEKSFDKLSSKFLTEMYENVKGFRSTGVSFDGKSLIVEGLIEYASGKTRISKFVLRKNGAGLIEGMNDTITNDENAFVFECDVSDGALRFSKMSYDMNVDALNESFRLKGSVNIG